MSDTDRLRDAAFHLRTHSVNRLARAVADWLDLEADTRDDLGINTGDDDPSTGYTTPLTELNRQPYKVADLILGSGA